MWGSWLPAHTSYSWTRSIVNGSGCREHPHPGDPRAQIQAKHDCHLARSHTLTNDVSQACQRQRCELATSPAAVVCVAQKAQEARWLHDRMWSEDWAGRRRRRFAYGNQELDRLGWRCLGDRKAGLRATSPWTRKGLAAPCPILCSALERGTSSLTCQGLTTPKPRLSHDLSFRTHGPVSKNDMVHAHCHAGSE